MSDPQQMMALGQAVVERCNARQEEALLEEHYAPGAVSVEAVEMPDGSREAVGRVAIKAKGDWWNNAHEVHRLKAEGPFVHGNRFHVIFDMDVTNKQTGERTQMREVGTYHVADGKIVREEFAYPLG